MARVEVVKEHIRAGDAFQVVLSQRFEVRTDVDGLDVYRVLRAQQPLAVHVPAALRRRETPYDVVGSSPEALVTVTGDAAVLHPIAGTKPRGATPEQDSALAAELLADPKERSEHVMLVDLGRNDLGRVCVAGSVDVVDFMQIERYSHVMHIVSTVVGPSRPTATALDVLNRHLPRPAPCRGAEAAGDGDHRFARADQAALYGGTVGYVDASGDMDMPSPSGRGPARRHGVRPGRRRARADSDPVAEQAECENKAAAVLRAIAAAATLRPADETAVRAGAASRPRSCSASPGRSFVSSPRAARGRPSTSATPLAAAGTQALPGHRPRPRAVRARPARPRRASSPWPPRAAPAACSSGWSCSPRAPACVAAVLSALGTVARRGAARPADRRRCAQLTAWPSSPRSAGSLLLLAGALTVARGRSWPRSGSATRRRRARGPSPRRRCRAEQLDREGPLGGPRPRARTRRLASGPAGPPADREADRT
jgi:hypothetical protein